MQMLVEAAGFVIVIGGFIVFAAVCAWSAQTLKKETGSVFSLSIIAGAFAFYNLVVKIGNGDAAFHTIERLELLWYLSNLREERTC